MDISNGEIKSIEFFTYSEEWDGLHYLNWKENSSIDLEEVTNALNGLKNQIKKLNNSIDAGRFSEDALKKAKELCSNLQRRADKIQDVLNRAKRDSQ